MLDARWLDGVSGQVTGFVARRLLAESVAMDVLGEVGPGAGVPRGTAEEDSAIRALAGCSTWNIAKRLLRRPSREMA
jgi:hypothetical protein